MENGNKRGIKKQNWTWLESPLANRRETTGTRQRDRSCTMVKVRYKHQTSMHHILSLQRNRAVKKQMGRESMSIINPKIRHCAFRPRSNPINRHCAVRPRSIPQIRHCASLVLGRPRSNPTFSRCASLVLGRHLLASTREEGFNQHFLPSVSYFPIIGLLTSYFCVRCSLPKDRERVHWAYITSSSHEVEVGWPASTQKIVLFVELLFRSTHCTGVGHNNNSELLLAMASYARLIHASVRTISRWGASKLPSCC